MSDNMISISEEVMWSTGIYTANNPAQNKIFDKLTHIIYNEELKQKTSIVSGVAEGVKRGLFESRFDFFEDPREPIINIKNFCAEAVLEVAKHVNKNYWQEKDNFSLQFHESWFHITRKGGSHDFHNHANCSWCGIYYLDIGESTKIDGGNSFFDPRLSAHNYSDYGTNYLSNSASFRATPKDGNLLIFPSYLYHSAPPYSGRKDRIVIAFNASIHCDP